MTIAIIVKVRLWSEVTMRVSKEQAAENRERILRAAADLIRECGISGAGVDALAKAAGLTHGSLYSQFGSKDRLAADAVRYALTANAEFAEQAKDLDSYLGRYLSVSHRESRGQGCALAALGCEMPRASEGVRSAFTVGLRRMVDRVMRLLGESSDKDHEEQALATATTMIGALILSRAVDDPALSDKILDASRKMISGSHLIAPAHPAGRAKRSRMRQQDDL